MKQILPALRSYLIFTLLCGLIYPVVVTLVGQSAFKNEANGSLIQRDGKVLGSILIAQKFENDRYFWGRPSAIDYNPLPSGGTNLGPTSQALKEAVGSRSRKLGNAAPKDLVYASGSGLDPHVSPEAALYQIPRISKVRGVPSEELRSMVLKLVENRQLGFLGEERINILRLNLALDEKR